MKKKIRIVEVGPRDGLQNEPNFKHLPEVDLVAARTEFVVALADAGLVDIEAGAFVRADRIPQMAATDKVLARIRETRPDLWKSRRFWCLVPNAKGLENAISAKAKHIAVFTSTSNAFNHANINMTVKESLREIETVVERALQNKMKVRGYISTVWGCPYEGKTNPRTALKICQRMLELGVSEVSLGDTIGIATPNRVEEVLQLFRKSWPIAVHFHDTRGTALANCLQAIRQGIQVVDSSAGGLGGCPYAKGASGNLATEDLLYMLRGMKFTSGVNLDKVCEAGEILGQKLELNLPSRYHHAWRAGRVQDQ